MIIAGTYFTYTLEKDSVAEDDKKPDSPPNFIVILTDDQGYADISINPYHQPYVSTPNIDALVYSGVFFSNGYTSGNVCSPTRAGIMTGRYQQRMGIYTANEGGSGVPLNEKMIPVYLKDAGYTSGAFGKWHMGTELVYNPVNRGFDEFYGFMGKGGHDYFCLKKSCTDAKFMHPMYRNLETIDDKGYLTDRISEEAISFINKNKNKPFFAYIAFNAVHAPPQAPKEDIALFNTGNERRNILMGMLRRLDIGIGNIIKSLKDNNIYENTVVILLTDNGGAYRMQADNTPLKGFKQQNYEGGIRVPFSISWPGKIAPGQTNTTPVMSFDILATMLDILNINPYPETTLDSKSLMRAIRGESIHNFLAWNSGDGRWAIRRNDWKLEYSQNQMELYNLSDDIGEQVSLYNEEAAMSDELKVLYLDWLDNMAPPKLINTVKKPLL
jgi:arylsulfatase A-like enzyme